MTVAALPFEDQFCDTVELAIQVHQPACVPVSD
jgi:hypothetical protein